MESFVKNIVSLFGRLLRDYTNSRKAQNKTEPEILDKIEKTSPSINVLPSDAKKVERENSVESWHPPVPDEHFAVPSQPYLQEDWELYGKFGHHTGVDYGGRRKMGIPLFSCADGEIIYGDTASSVWGAFLGNHAVVYAPSVNKSFLYCHMAEEPRALGPIKAGEQIGIMGNTGKSAGGAIHLHIEGFHGRFEISQRSFKSLDDIKVKTFDADQFIRSRLI